MFDIFHRVANIGWAAKKRKQEQYQEFLEFYRLIVETIHPDIVSLFGKMSVGVIDINNKQREWTMLLTIGDYLFWKAEIANGVEFILSPLSVKRNMLYHLAVQSEKQGLEPEERKVILNLLDPK